MAGPREAGSDAEQRAARHIEARLRSMGLETSSEPFPVYPRAAHALIVGGGVLYLTAYGLYFVCPFAAILTVVTLVTLLAVQSVRGSSPLTWPLRQRQSQNVVGRLAPRGERKHLLLFGGHHDSAYRMPLLQRHLYRIVFLAVPMFLLAGLALVLLSVLTMVSVSSGVAGTILLTLASAGTVCAVLLPAGMVRSDAVMGANDNLSAVGVMLELARRTSIEPPRHTEIWFVSFGSEETGLVGSRAFVQAHREELREATLINLECLGQSGNLRALGFELMAGVRHLPEARERLLRAGERADISVVPGGLPAGMTDAASFSRAGLRATTLIRLDAQGYLDHYHNPGDDVPALREEHLREALAVCEQVVAALEEEG